MSTATRTLRNFIGGEHADPADGRTSAIVDPSTAQVVAEAPVSGAADVDRALSALQV